jgi:hypothetical protein
MPYKQVSLWEVTLRRDESWADHGFIEKKVQITSDYIDHVGGLAQGLEPGYTATDIKHLGRIYVENT